MVSRVSLVPRGWSPWFPPPPRFPSKDWTKRSSGSEVCNGRMRRWKCGSSRVSQHERQPEARQHCSKTHQLSQTSSAATRSSLSNSRHPAPGTCSVAASLCHCQNRSPPCLPFLCNVPTSCRKLQPVAIDSAPARADCPSAYTASLLPSTPSHPCVAM